MQHGSWEWITPSKEKNNIKYKVQISTNLILKDEIKKNNQF
jgi:hypothetical protein